MALGLMFLVAKPLGVADEWAFYVYSLILAAASGLFCSWRYQVSVIERTDERVVMRCGRRKSMARNSHVSDKPL